MHARLKAEGVPFEIVAFPCNQFGGQEPGTAMDIRALADSFDAKFVIASKVEVNGSNAHPLFEFAKAALPGVCGTTGVKWNFTKFLFDATGAPSSSRRLLRCKKPCVHSLHCVVYAFQSIVTSFWFRFAEDRRGCPLLPRVLCRACDDAGHA